MNIDNTINYILNSFHEKKNSHAFLLSTNNLNNCLNDVISIIKSINCSNKSLNNCDCNICRTIDTFNNPDLLLIKPDGKEIKKDQILDIIKMFSTKPLINKYSIYVILEADKMNEAAANKILKFLEEPEGNIIGFFITDNVQGIIPTIRSRCELYNFKYGSDNVLSLLEINEEQFGKYYDDTMELVYKLNDASDYVLMADSKKYSSKERKEIEAILTLLKRIYIIKYENILNGSYSDLDYAKNILDAVISDDLKIIVKRINLLDNILNDFKFNVNKDLYINKLFMLWE